MFKVDNDVCMDCLLTTRLSFFRLSVSAVER